MKYLLILTIGAFMAGCSASQVSVPEMPAFKAELSNGGEVAVDKSGMLQLTYVYPACLVEGPDKKQITVQYNTAGAGNVEPGALRALGTFTLAVLEYLVRQL